MKVADVVAEIERKIANDETWQDALRKLLDWIIQKQAGRSVYDKWYYQQNKERKEQKRKLRLKRIEKRRLRLRLAQRKCRENKLKLGGR